MLLNGDLHCLVTELLVQAKTRFNSSQMESTSLVAHVNYILSSNHAEMALATIATACIDPHFLLSSFLYVMN